MCDHIKPQNQQQHHYSPFTCKVFACSKPLIFNFFLGFSLFLLWCALIQYLIKMTSAGNDRKWTINTQGKNENMLCEQVQKSNEPICHASVILHKSVGVRWFESHTKTDWDMPSIWSTCFVKWVISFFHKFPI